MTRHSNRPEEPATSSTCSIPIGVSIMAQMPMPAGAPDMVMTASAWRTVSALSTFGNNTASAPLVDAAAKSSYPHGDDRGLMRMTSSR